MSNFYKDMKFPNLEKQKVLSLDDEGKVIATETNVADLSTKEYVDAKETALNTRMDAIEASVVDATARLQAINGETTE